MDREWQTFVSKVEDMKEGEVRLFIKDLTPGPRKYDTKFVRAKVMKWRESQPLSDTDVLFIRPESGVKSPEPWQIKILEELPPWVPGSPWENVFEAIKKVEREK
jgi:hypothetical protein